VRPFTKEAHMSNLPVRKVDNGNQGIARRTEWEPFHWMRSMLGWDPFREMVPELPRLQGALFAPAFEVKETAEGFTFTADVPGVAEKDIEITRTGNRLTVTGKRESTREEKGDTYYVCERDYGSFTRAFTLPDGTDSEHTRADLKDGVLTVVIPKIPTAQPKKIPLQGAEKKS
jgi:HSP20 family protein